MVTNDCSMLPVEDRFFVSQNYGKLTPDELVASKVQNFNDSTNTLTR